MMDVPAGWSRKGAALVLVAVAALGCARAGLSEEMPAIAPRTEQATSTVKALTPEQIEDLLAGRGMGLARAAELNHYPGPRHALDLADPLGLAEDQRSRARLLFSETQAASREIGRRLLAAEAALDGLFASGKADEENLAAQVREIARLQGELRLVHLSAHLAMRRLLDPAQIALYDRLRGHGGGQAPEQDDGAHRHGG